MSSMPFIRMGKDMKGNLKVWIYDGDSNSGVPLNPLKIVVKTVRNADGTKPKEN